MRATLASVALALALAAAVAAAGASLARHAAFRLEQARAAAALESCPGIPARTCGDATECARVLAAPEC